MTLKIQHRPVVVEGETFEVPTNVCWQASYRRWIVSTCKQYQRYYAFFKVGDYYETVRAAFEAAVADMMRQRNGAPPRLPTGRVKVAIADRPAPPPGIEAQVVKRQQRPHYRLIVRAGKKPFRSFLVGPVEAFDPKVYQEQLNKAIEYMSS